MTTRSEREKAEKENEQHQAILSQLLREEENKFCADCEAKGPRWAAWNLGVFVCIRCAGIHRNLGVHISRVKSVNLDQWTHDQIQSMVDMGNTRARQVYEAHLPDSFRRPQSDQAVEVFIRDKYERKKYLDEKALNSAPKKSSSAAVPPASSSPSSQADKNKVEKDRERKKEERKREKDADKGEKHNTKMSESKASPKKSPEPAAVDLLNLDAPETVGKSSGAAAPISDQLDVFGPMVSNNTQQANSSSAPPQGDSSSSSSTTATTKVEEKKKKLLSKDSILSLYASSPVSQQQQQPGQAGVHMGFNPGVGGVATTLPNGGYVGVQQQHQQQNMNQVTQQMSGMAVGGAERMQGSSGWTTQQQQQQQQAASGQTLSTQLWK